MIDLFMTVVPASFVSMFMAWTIGAGSSGSTPFAPAVGANAIKTMTAGFYVGLLGLFGAALQGSNIAEAVGGDLVRGVTLTPTAVIVALFVAGTLMAVGIWKGYPISSAFVVTGAIVGSGMALGGSPSWTKYTEVGLMWTVGPIIGVGMSYILVKLLQDDRFSTQLIVSGLTCIITVIILNVEFYIPPYGMTPLSEVLSSLFIGGLIVRAIITLLVSTSISLYAYHKCSSDEEAFMKRFLVVIGSIVAFSAGGSQVGLAVGPLIPLSDTIPLSVAGITFGGGLGMLLGSWTGAPRMIKAVSQDYAQLGPRRSVSALTPAFMLAQTAILLGVPISFNQMVVSCIVGAGLGSNGSDDSDSVGRKKMLFTVGAWIATLIGSFIITYVFVIVITGTI